jgi:hypothetical protein
LTKGREGKNQDEKEKNPSDDPNVLTPVSHRAYFNPNIAVSNVKVQMPNK